MTVNAAGPRITLQFHPNWPHQGHTVIESITSVGIYRSQFETGISNGGLTAFPGGDRWDWEGRLFDTRVLDPCCRGTTVEVAAHTLGTVVEFHPGFRANPADFDPDYRGEHIAALAQSLGDELTPAIIGDAARAGTHDPQHIKQVWHCLARYGRAGG